MSLDRLQAMTVLVKVVEQGSVAGAAERMNISTLAVSRHVALLEAHLDARLLNRTTRRVLITEIGQALYERTLQLSALCRCWSICRKQKPQPRSITPRHAAAYVSAARSISRCRTWPPPLAHLRRAIRRCYSTFPHPIVLSIWWRKGGGKRPQELVKHNCLTNEFASVKNHWPLLDRQRHELKIAVKGSAHASSGEMLATIAAQAVGIAHQPNFIVEPPFKTGRPVPILAKYQPALCHIYAV